MLTGCRTNDNVKMANADSNVVASLVAGKKMMVTAAVRHVQEVQLNYLMKPLTKSVAVVCCSVDCLLLMGPTASRRLTMRFLAVWTVWVRRLRWLWCVPLGGTFCGVGGCCLGGWLLVSICQDSLSVILCAGLVVILLLLFDLFPWVPTTNMTGLTFLRMTTVLLTTVSMATALLKIRKLTNSVIMAL